MLTLLHPSRGRVDRSFDTVSKWMAHAKSNDIELIVSVDDDDPLRQTYVEAYSNIYNNFDIKASGVLVNPNRSTVDAINNAAKVATGDIMIVLSDDTDCPDNWAELIENEVRGKKDFVLKTDDGIQPWIVTMPVMDREYYNRFGYIYHPSFFHMFCDTDLSHVAYGLNKVIKSNLLFPHLHYSVKKLGIKPDEINHRADRTTTEGRNTYLERFKRGFDIPGFDVWNFEDEAHDKWLRAHGFKRPYR
jgi:glycosyltransferase involved in cell wall biosynthesis